MAKKNNFKVSRGRLEEDRRKEADAIAYQRVMLFLLPLIMVAVLVIGIFFGYKSYQSEYVKLELEHNAMKSSEPMYSAQEQSQLLQIVNSANTVDSSYVPKLADFSAVQVNSLMISDLKRLMSDASEQGLELEVVSGYISFEEQKDIYQTAVNKYKKKHKCSTVKAEAAIKKTTPKEGECEQQTGLVIKFDDNSNKKFSDTAEFAWLEKNCVNYGFVLRYPDKENTGGLKYSPNLFRYVGVDNAKTMRAYDMNLDEYVVYLN